MYTNGTLRQFYVQIHNPRTGVLGYPSRGLLTNPALYLIKGAFIRILLDSGKNYNKIIIYCQYIKVYSI
jgi:hypothetical protein